MELSSPRGIKGDLLLRKTGWRKIMLLRRRWEGPRRGGSAEGPAAAGQPRFTVRPRRGISGDYRKFTRVFWMARAPIFREASYTACCKVNLETASAKSTSSTSDCSWVEYT